MNILFANNLRGHYGGVEQVVYQYALGLTERGHKCNLAYGANGREVEQFSAAFEDTFPCSEFGMEQESEDTELTGDKFDEILARVTPDVVFVHKLKNLPPGLEHNTAVRKVVLVHDHDLWCPTGLGYYRHNRRVCQHPAGWRCYLDLAFLERNSGSPIPVSYSSIGKKINAMRRYHHFDTILANSTYMRNQLLASGFPEAKTRVFFPVLRESETVATPVPDEPRILYAGSLIRGKGVDLLLQAFSRLQRPAQLDVVGVGKSEGQLKALSSSLNLDERVHFAGWVAHEALADYYQRARIIAVPSCWPEPFGLVGMEAMRHGRPVVAFDVGGIPDWLAREETGILVSEHDIEGYAAALDRLLADSALARQMGERGSQRAAEHFAFAPNLTALESQLEGAM